MRIKLPFIVLSVSFNSLTLSCRIKEFCRLSFAILTSLRKISISYCFFDASRIINQIEMMIFWEKVENVYFNRKNSKCLLKK